MGSGNAFFIYSALGALTFQILGIIFTELYWCDQRGGCPSWDERGKIVVFATPKSNKLQKCVPDSLAYEIINIVKPEYYGRLCKTFLKDSEYSKNSFDQLILLDKMTNGSLRNWWKEQVKDACIWVTNSKTNNDRNKFEQTIPDLPTTICENTTLYTAVRELPRVQLGHAWKGIYSCLFLTLFFILAGIVYFAFIRAKGYTDRPFEIMQRVVSFFMALACALILAGLLVYLIYQSRISQPFLDVMKRICKWNEQKWSPYIVVTLIFAGIHAIMAAVAALRLKQKRPPKPAEVEVHREVDRLSRQTNYDAMSDVYMIRHQRARSNLRTFSGERPEDEEGERKPSVRTSMSIIS